MKKGEKRKFELLQIAYKLFLTNGYENTSVDKIIEEAKIAKGTYYYYFSSKEQMLEEVIEMMLNNYTKRANEILLNNNLSLPEKAFAIIASFQPNAEELPIVDILNSKDNLIMHDKINKKTLEKIIPMLSALVEEGVKTGILNCNNIPERVKIIMFISNQLFDNMDFSDKDVEVFIDVIEKILGAKTGTMTFIKNLIIKRSLE